MFSYKVASFREICCDRCLYHVKIAVHFVIACRCKSSKFNNFALHIRCSVIFTCRWWYKLFIYEGRQYLVYFMNLYVRVCDLINEIGKIKPHKNFYFTVPCSKSAI